MNIHVHKVSLLTALASMLLLVACIDGRSFDVSDSGALRVSPASIDFGQVTPGFGMVSTFEVINETSHSVRLEPVYITPRHDDFRLLNVPEEAINLEAGENIRFDIEYQPAAQDVAQAMIQIETGHDEYPLLEVTLLGYSLTDEEDPEEDPDEEFGRLQLDTTSIDFDLVKVGQVVNETVTVTNVGNAALEIIDATVNGEDFGISGQDIDGTLAAGESVELTVEFAPLGGGTVHGSIVVDSDDPQTSQATITLRGEGDAGCGESCNPDIHVDANALDFGSLGGGTGLQTISVTNTGVDPLHLSGMYSTGSLANGTISIAAGDAYATVEPGATEFLTIEWTPGELFPGYGCMDGMDGGSSYLALFSDDPDEPEIAIDLYGCCDGTGAGLCSLYNWVSVLMCVDDSVCNDPVLGLLHCTIGTPC